MIFSECFNFLYVKKLNFYLVPLCDLLWGFLKINIINKTFNFVLCNDLFKTCIYNHTEIV